jgi:hypothetical protein
MNVSIIFTMKNRTLAAKLIVHSSTTTPCFIMKSGDLFLNNSLLNCQSGVYLFMKAKID